MAVSGIGDNGLYAPTSGKPQPQSPASSTLTMDSFMKLMAVQLQNQDMSNPMDNSEMMNQLTQMATVQSMNTFTELATTQYSMTMIGQTVKVASVDDKGAMIYKYGKVSGVNLTTNTVYLEGDENTSGYGIGNIMEVGTVPKKEDEEDDNVDGDKDDGKVDGPDGPGSGDDDKVDGPGSGDDDKNVNSDNDSKENSEKKKK